MRKIRVRTHLRRTRQGRTIVNTHQRRIKAAQRLHSPAKKQYSKKQYIKEFEKGGAEYLACPYCGYPMNLSTDVGSPTENRLIFCGKCLREFEINLEVTSLSDWDEEINEVNGSKENEKNQNEKSS